MPLLQNTRFLTRISKPLHRNLSSYTIEEIKIPIPSKTNSFLAGKLWRSSSNATPSKTPPILCMHGLQDNCGSFDALLPLLFKPNGPSDLVIFAMDMPGHGHSSPTPELIYNYPSDGLISIHRVLRHFSWPKITLLGHSMGAIICFLFAACFPGHTTSYIALDNLRPLPRSNDPTPTLQTMVDSTFLLESKLTSTSTRPSYTYDQLLSRTFSSRSATVSLEGCAHLLKRGAERVDIDGEERFRFTHDIKTGVISSLRLFSEEQTRNLAKRIVAPVCVIKGNPGNDYEPREDFLGVVTLLRESAERLELHFVEGSHHFHLNRAEDVAPIVGRFLGLN